MDVENVQSHTDVRESGVFFNNLTGAVFRSKYLRIYRSYVPIWMLFLAALEVLVLGFTFFLTSLLFHTYNSNYSNQVEYLSKVDVGFYIVALFVSMVSMGLYQRRLREGSAGIALRVLAAHALGAVLLLVLYSLIPAIAIKSAVVLVSIIFSCSGILFSRIFFLRLVGTDVFKRRVLVLGSGKRAADMTNLKRWIDQVGYTIVGFIHVDGDNDKVDPSKMIRLKEGDSLVKFVRNNCIDEIVVAFDDRRQKISMDDLLDCKMEGVHIIDALNFYERETYKLKLDIMDPSWLIFSDGFKNNLGYKFTKRFFDIAVSSLILILSMPFMLLAAILIVIESGFPLFYTQTRVGECGKHFKVIKFRSMVVNAEKNGAQWASKGDSRVTKVGAFIRLTRIDELPQLINVLKGDMSFVGPRPERPEFVEQFIERIPYYDERHRVRPGITGWAQICYPYGASEEDAYEKLQYDLYYAKNYSLFLDFMILLQTAEVIIWQKGAR